jgi:transcriptional regulator
VRAAVEFTAPPLDVAGGEIPEYPITHGVGADVTESDTALPLLKGTLDLLILKTLSWGPMHGYAIAKWLEDRSDGSLGVEDNALYQALQRLETRDLVSAEWGVTPTKRRARYYRLTPAGRRKLRDDTTVWMRYTRFVTGILRLSSRTA